MSYTIVPVTTTAGSSVSIPEPSSEDIGIDLGITVQWNNENEALIFKKTPILWTLSLSWDFIIETDAQSIIDVFKTDSLTYIVYTCSFGVFHCRLTTPDISVTRIAACDSYSMGLDLEGRKQ